MSVRHLFQEYSKPVNTSERTPKSRWSSPHVSTVYPWLATIIQARAGYCGTIPQAFVARSRLACPDQHLLAHWLKRQFQICTDHKRRNRETRFDGQRQESRMAFQDAKPVRLKEVR